MPRQSISSSSKKICAANQFNFLSGCVSWGTSLTCFLLGALLVICVLLMSTPQLPRGVKKGDIVEEKRGICLEVGATHFINSKTENINQKFDVIIDTTGIPEVIANATTYLSGNGRLILVGQPKPDQKLEIPTANKLFDGIGKTIKATQGGKTNPTEDIPRYIKLHKAGLLDITKIITHRFDLNDINKAFDLLRSGKAGRIIININK